MARAKKIKAADVLEVVQGAAKAKMVSVDELAEQLIDAAGGVKKFATIYVEEMNNTRGIARARMLESVMRTVGTSSTINKKRGDDEATMSEQELMDEALALLNKGRANAA